MSKKGSYIGGHTLVYTKVPTKISVKKNKKKSVTIRITEQQYRNLIDTIVEEEINKSEFIRESIKYQIGRKKRNNRRNLS